jgi:hypothetical protein
VTLTGVMPSDLNNATPAPQVPRPAFSRDGFSSILLIAAHAAREKWSYGAPPARVNINYNLLNLGEALLRVGDTDGGSAASIKFSKL